MTIYGTGLLAACLLVGLLTGEMLGRLIGIEANVGGVGIAMLLLVWGSDLLRQRGRLSKPSQSGVLFWSAIYIPVVVAMAACQNVYAALSGGTVALLAGSAAVIAGLLMVPVVSRIGRNNRAAGDDHE